MRERWVIHLAIGWACLFLSLAALAADRVTVAGSVRAPGGVPAPGATLTLGGAAQATFFTDDAGAFRLSLPPGRYTLRATLLGFLPRESTFEIQAGKAPGTIEVKLEMAPPPRSLARAGLAARPQGPANGNGDANDFQTLNAQPGEETVRADTSADVLPGNALAAPSVQPDLTPDMEASGDAFLVAGNMARSIAPSLDFDSEDRGGGRRRAGRANLNREGAPADGNAARKAQTPEERRQALRERFQRAMADRERGGPGGGPGGGRGGAMGGGPGGNGDFQPGGFSGGPEGGGMPGGPGGGMGGFWGGGAVGNLNRIRGNVRLRYSDSLFDARAFSFSGQPQDKLPYSNEQVSVTAGGPLRIPKLGGRTQFMVNYEERRGRSSSDTTTTVPLAAQRAGDFSAIPNIVYDPATGQPFAGNRIPAERVNPAAAALLRFIPLPDLSGTALNYHLQQTLPAAQDSLNVRVSRGLSQRTRSNVFASYNLTSSRNDRGQIFPDLFTHSRSLGQNVAAGITNIIRQRGANDFRVMFNRMRLLSTNDFAGKQDVLGPLGIEGVSLAPEDWGVPSLSFSNFGRLSDSSPVLRRNNAWRINDNLTYTKNRHTLRAGASVGWGQTALRTNPNPRGSFSFTGLATSGFDGSDPVANTGFDLADFLLGLPNSTSIRYGQNNTYFNKHWLALYGQDDIRAGPRFSLTLGLRYEYFPPPVEKYDHIVNLDVAPGFSGVAAVLPGQDGPYTGQFPRALVGSDANNFAPRVGLAWKPARRVIVRAGYSVFYDNTVWDRIDPQMATQPPFAITTTRLTSAARVLTLQQPFPAEPPKTVKNTFAVDRNFVLPYVQNCNLSLQRDFGRGFLVEAGYLGTKGSKLYLIRAPNRAPAGSQLTSEQRRQIGNAVGFQYHTAGASSIYHAFQARLHRRFARGVTVSAQYTYGKSIDNASSIGGVGNMVAQDDANLAAERGLSSFDQRHRVDIRYVYEFPFGPRHAFLKEGWAARLLGTWQVSGGATILSGQPFTAQVGGNRANNSGSGGGGDRADATGASVLLEQPSVNAFFNTAAFAIPAAGQFGNAGRNTIPGPGSTAFNTSLAKSFRFGEAGPRGEVRLESTNTFNTPAFSSLGTVLNAYNFGRITGARAMRTLQWQVRISF